MDPVAYRPNAFAACADPLLSELEGFYSLFITGPSLPSERELRVFVQRLSDAELSPAEFTVARRQLADLFIRINADLPSSLSQHSDALTRLSLEEMADLIEQSPSQALIDKFAPLAQRRCITLVRPTQPDQLRPLYFLGYRIQKVLDACSNHGLEAPPSLGAKLASLKRHIDAAPLWTPPELTLSLTARNIRSPSDSLVPLAVALRAFIPYFRARAPADQTLLRRCFLDRQFVNLLPILATYIPTLPQTKRELLSFLQRRHLQQTSTPPTYILESYLFPEGLPLPPLKESLTIIYQPSDLPLSVVGTVQTAVLTGPIL